MKPRSTSPPPLLLDALRLRIGVRRVTAAAPHDACLSSLLLLVAAPGMLLLACPVPAAKLLLLLLLVP